ncbi:MAG TPA: FAD-dependent oxidoreductase [Terriglobales bacterium]|nr:FAD-dependent oxidoreductase [Terriglobales bacterium]
MSTVPTVSALDANTQTFPVLTSAQIERARLAGSIRHVENGEVLFRPGDVGIPMFVLLSGGMEILQPSYLGERLITTHSAGHFTGELSMISGQRCLVLGRVTDAGEFLEIPVNKLRALIARDAELSEMFMRAFILRRLALITHKLGNVILLGSRHSAETLHLREFLDRNGHPHTYVDLDRDKQSQQLLDHFAVKLEDIPLVICNGQNVLRNPSTRELADCLGLNANFDDSEVRDVVIVGAGPAGLGAAVYAASEGLNSLLIETEAPGGQAGSSSKIENYLGFPTGISGQELAARALNQAQKFGARMLIARSAIKLDCAKHPYKLVLDDGAVVATRAIIIATGAHYNKPEIENLEKFEGRGIYYGATHIEAQLCAGDDAVVVGGGNSAGQAAIFVSQIARKVYMLVRGSGLAETMSRYLIQRIAENPNIELLCNTEITKLEGATELERVTWANNITGESVTKPIRHVFVMTGASPRTDWLRGCVALDDKGFILTGRDLEPAGHGSLSASWPLARAPQMLETSLPGVFAVGDVRSGNVKRVASAVGEGAISVHLVHRTLAEL